MDPANLPVPDDFNFPFEPYLIQQQFMENLFRVIDAKKIGKQIKKIVDLAN